ncbi:MAG: O-methyltransferase [Sphingomonas sp.]
MVERTQPEDERWAAVDAYIEGHLLPQDFELDFAVSNSAKRGLDDIAVAPVQGKLLHLMARMVGAKRILEIGTLGGYSTIWLGRALPEDGEMVSLELVGHNAMVARENLAAAGLAGRVKVIDGPALDTLEAMTEPFDFVFIDADKQNNAAYLDHAIRLSRPGTTIVVDNVVREGGVLDVDSTDERIIGTRALFDSVATNLRLTATAVQTVGVKKWDGFLLAIVD